jgi:putative redox protein
MSVTMKGHYTGQFKMQLHHDPSGTEMHTAAPKDNQGDGSSFSPTDMVGAALGACMCTIIAMVAEREGIDCSQLAFSVEKHMSTDTPRRIASLPIHITLPKGLTDSQRAKLEHAAKTCPVHHSLHPDISIDISYSEA